jgi:hypothetical protein
MTKDDLAKLERIDQLNIPDEFKPTLKAVAKYVLTHAKQFQATAETLNGEIADAKRPPADVLHCSISPDGGPSPESFHDDHEQWQARMMLLATLAVYPGDLSQFGACGKIPWHTEMVKVGRKKHQVDFALGRDWMLFGVGGETPHDDMLDRAGEVVATHHGELIDGKVQNYVKRTPWQVRGALGRLADRLKPILKEFGVDLSTRTGANRETGEIPEAKLPLSELQKDVWNILESRTARYDQHGMPHECLTGPEIADELAKAGIRNQDGKSIGDVIKEIRTKGWPISNQRGQGYYIPNRSPETRPN